jgi:hypothetical protein
MGPRIISDPVPGATPGKLVSDIAQAALARRPDRKHVMKLVLQLLKTALASGRGSPTFKTAIANIASMQIALGDKVPELRSIDLTIFGG